MPKALSIRACAALTVTDVLKGRSLTESLAQGRFTGTPADKALVSELAYGSCRWWYQLDSIAQLLLAKSFKKRDQDIHALLVVGLYQLQHTRVPPHAAVSETAGAARDLGKKWAVAVVNGVLRRFQREQDVILDKLKQSPEFRYAQPRWFVEQLRQSWPNQWQQILEGLLQRPPFSIRVNLHKTSRDDYLLKLKQVGMTAEPVQDVPSALVLDKAVSVDALPGFAEGMVSVQDAGAQLAAFILNPRPGDRVLDACAAPGGKTGHLLEATQPLDMLAMDVDEQRLQRVAENLQRLSFEAKLIVGDASKSVGSSWGEKQYERILLDAPCTATGVMRRHPDIKLLRRATDVQELVVRQRAILNELWKLLKPGGRLLYATCSVLNEENEGQIASFVEGQADAKLIKLDNPWGQSLEFGLQTLPGERSMDGFYYSLLEKNLV